MKIKISVLLLVISLFTACIEEYSPKIDGYKDILVVEGVITNEPGPYVIRLSKSLTTYDLNYVPVAGANIVISDDLNTEETLLEIKPGVYTTDSLGIRGIVGRKYRITIKINGETYQSNFEELLKPLGIDSVYTKVENRETLEGSFEGLQFYINTDDTNYENMQILWTLTETYKYKSDLFADFLYSPGTIIGITIDTINICWQTGAVSQIFTYATQNNTEANIRNFPLHYVSTNTKKLSERYSLMINQYSITNEALKYWNEIKKQNTESSSLYATQPFQIRGNIVNINNPDNIMLGYFLVAGRTKKRVYIDRPELVFVVECESTYSYFLAYLRDPDTKYPIYVTDLGEGKFGSAPQSCFDCRTRGGILIKPDFWED